MGREHWPFIYNNLKFTFSKLMSSKCVFLNFTYAPLRFQSIPFVYGKLKKRILNKMFLISFRSGNLTDNVTSAEEKSCHGYKKVDLLILFI